MNVADDLLATIFTDAGTDAADLFELVKVTHVPEGPARPFRTIFPITVVADPPTTVEGVRVNTLGVARKISNEQDTEPKF